MKKKLLRTSAATTVFAFVLGCLLMATACNGSGAKLQVLNPRGEIELPPVAAPSARIAELGGKTIGLYWNEKAGGNHFWNGIEQLLKKRLPDTKILRYRGAFDLGDALAAKVAGEADAFLYGVGD
jgi:hypothetical protein